MTSSRPDRRSGPGEQPAIRPWAVDRRTFLRRTGALGLTVGVGGGLLAACDMAEDPAAAPGAEPDDDGATPAAPEANGVLSIRLVQDIENLDPAFMPATVDDAVMLCIAENLLTFRPGTTELVNELAAEFTSSEDGLTHEFRLKEGIQFHGGFGEVTADDVKFSFERIAGLTDPPIESTYADDWATLEEVEVTGDYTGTIRLSEPFPPLLASTIPAHAGMILSRAAWEERGEDIATQPIGSGPYEFVEWERGQLVVLRRFEDWGEAALEWAEEPQWDEIHFRPIPDDSAADIAVETGEVGFGLVSHASVDRFEDDGSFEVTQQTTLDYGWIGFNVTDDDLADVDVRRAIRQALDVDSMIDAAFEGHTTRAHALIAPEMPLGHWEDAPSYDRDVDAARELLEQAGVDELSLEMSIVEEPGSRVIAEIVQANLAEIGIDVSIRLRERAEMREQLDALQLFYQSFSNQADPSWATVWFTSDQIDAWNFMSWSNEEYDELHEQALREVDEDTRHDVYVRMQEIMDEEAVAAWVMYRTHHYAHAPGLEPSLVTARYGKYRPWDIRA
jgi:peptide/nickel transport system substrate-binding protein